MNNKMFEDPKLNWTLEIHCKSREAHIEKLNKIGRDIKTLESLIKDSAVQAGTGISIQLKEECGFLSWNGNRIVWKISTLMDAKPLIECKFPIRIEIANYLPSFLEMCFKSIKKELNQ